MGMLYRRKKRDSFTQNLVEFGPWWIKYYRQGRPFYESTETEDKTEARRKLKKREGEVALGLHQGPQVERTKFEDLVNEIQQDYMMNERKTVRRLHEYLAHLSGFFRHMRASAITTDKIRIYITQRQEAGAANGTVNRELGILKRMFRLAHQQTPPKVAEIPYIPMLEERNVRSGFFEHEDFFSPARSLTGLCSGDRDACLL
jgi:hypothetical protein